MGLDRSRTKLGEEIARLGDYLRGLELTLSDKPVSDEDALAERLLDSAVALIGTCEEAAHVAAQGDDLASFARLHVLVIELMRRFHDEIAATARLRSLMQMAHRRGGEWQSWVLAVQASIDQGWTRLFATASALAEHLAELGERQQAPAIALPFPLYP